MKADFAAAKVKDNPKHEGIEQIVIHERVMPKEMIFLFYFYDGKEEDKDITIMI